MTPDGSTDRDPGRSVDAPADVSDRLPLRQVPHCQVLGAATHCSRSESVPVRLRKRHDGAEAGGSETRSADDAPSDETLMQRYLAGDASAFQTILERHGQRI